MKSDKTFEEKFRALSLGKKRSLEFTLHPWMEFRWPGICAYSLGRRNCFRRKLLYFKGIKRDGHAADRQIIVTL